MIPHASSRNSAGTTLLEIIVAMTILALLVAALFAAFTFGPRVAASSGGRLEAMGFVQQTAESLRSAVGTAKLNANYPAGVTDPLPALPPTDRLAPFHPVRRYIVRNGKFKADGTITWSPNTAGQVQNDEHGNPINDTNYDLKEVRIQVEWTPPPKS